MQTGEMRTQLRNLALRDRQRLAGGSRILLRFRKCALACFERRVRLRPGAASIGRDPIRDIAFVPAQMPLVVGVGARFVFNRLPQPLRRKPGAGQIIGDGRNLPADRVELGACVEPVRRAAGEPLVGIRRRATTRHSGRRQRRPQGHRCEDRYKRRNQ